MDLTPLFVKHRVVLLVLGLVGALAMEGLAAWWHVQHRAWRQPAVAVTAAEALQRPNVRLRLTDARLDCTRAILLSDRVAPALAPTLSQDDLLILSATEEPCTPDAFRREGVVERLDHQRQLAAMKRKGLSAPRIWVLRDADDPGSATWLFAIVGAVLLGFGLLGFYPYPDMAQDSVTPALTRERIVDLLSVRPLQFEPSFLRRVWWDYLGASFFLGMMLLVVLFFSSQIMGALNQRARWNTARPVEGSASLSWDERFAFMPRLLASAKIAWRTDEAQEEDHLVLWKTSVTEPIALRADGEGLLTSAAIELVPQRILGSGLFSLFGLLAIAWVCREVRKSRQQQANLLRLAMTGRAEFFDLLETEVLSQYGIPSGHRVYQVRAPDGRVSKHMLKHPRAPVFAESGSAVLVVSGPGMDPVLIASDGYPVKSS